MSRRDVLYCMSQHVLFIYFFLVFDLDLLNFFVSLEIKLNSMQ